MPATPGMALGTPVMSAPAAIPPVASTALSVNAAQPAIQLDATQIAEKWGHPNGLANHAEPKQVNIRFLMAASQHESDKHCLPMPPRPQSRAKPIHEP